MSEEINQVDLKTPIHIRWRYATRILKEYNKSENEYRGFIKSAKGKELDERVTKCIKEDFNNSELFYTGKLSKHVDNPCRYYSNVDKMVTFLADEKEDKGITCYKIFFDMGDKLDKQLANGL